ncbi:hypothetical protein KA005_18020 [bacterium]|nr:hypothetical protein [bacterium]
MGTISKDTFKRLFLLYTIGRFKKGVYGRLRLNKIVYFATKDASLVPFEFKHDHYGQHSKDLDDINEQLLSMKHATATPLESEQGNKYALTSEDNWKFYEIALSRIDHRLKTKVDEVVENLGYDLETDLKRKAYADPRFLESEDGDILFKENLNETIDVDLPEDDCEDLELSLDPKFISAMTRLSDWKGRQ